MQVLGHLLRMLEVYIEEICRRGAMCLRDVPVSIPALSCSKSTPSTCQREITASSNEAKSKSILAMALHAKSGPLLHLYRCLLQLTALQWHVGIIEGIESTMLI